MQPPALDPTRYGDGDLHGVATLLVELMRWENNQLRQSITLVDSRKQEGVEGEEGEEVVVGS